MCKDLFDACKAMWVQRVVVLCECAADFALPIGQVELPVHGVLIKRDLSSICTIETHFKSSTPGKHWDFLLVNKKNVVYYIIFYNLGLNVPRTTYMWQMTSVRFINI